MATSVTRPPSPPDDPIARHLFHLETLLETGREIHSLRAVRPILKTVAMTISRTLGINQVVVGLFRRPRKTPILVYFNGFERSAVEEALAPPPFVFWEMEDHQRIRVMRDAGEAGRALLARGVRLWISLWVDRNLYAGIGLSETLEGKELAEHATFLDSLCGQTEIAVRNAYHYQSLQRVNHKRRGEMRKNQALYRLSLTATSTFDQQKLADEMLIVLVGWAGATAGRLVLPTNSEGIAFEASLGSVDDPDSVDSLQQMADEIQRRGLSTLLTIESDKTGKVLQHALCLTVRSRNRKRAPGLLMLIGGARVQRAYQHHLHNLVDMTEQMVRTIELNRLEAENHQLEEDRRAAQRANQAKSSFLAHMSHELRTPLNAINAMSDILMEQYFGKLNERQTGYVTDIRDSGHHLLSLINDILDLSKAEAGHSPLELSSVYLKSLIEESFTLVRERAFKHGIALSMELPGDLPQITADERKVKQILVNLLTNAVKFTLKGGQVGVIASLKENSVKVCVWDTGIGIPAEDHEKIFDRFVQSQSSLSRNYEGTGLGLALVRRFAEQHSGKVWVESTLGVGSRFYFTLPLEPSCPDPGLNESHWG